MLSGDRQEMQDDVSACMSLPRVPCIHTPTLATSRSLEWKGDEDVWQIYVWVSKCMYRRRESLVRMYVRMCVASIILSLPPSFLSRSSDSIGTRTAKERARKAVDAAAASLQTQLQLKERHSSRSHSLSHIPRLIIMKSFQFLRKLAAERSRSRGAGKRGSRG